MSSFQGALIKRGSLYSDEPGGGMKWEGGSGEEGGRDGAAGEGGGVGKLSRERATLTADGSICDRHL